MSTHRVDKIRKLLAKAEDPAASEAESETYSTKAQRMQSSLGRREGEAAGSRADIGQQRFGQAARGALGQ